jgi:hypothetical protein
VNGITSTGQEQRTVIDKRVLYATAVYDQDDRCGSARARRRPRTIRLGKNVAAMESEVAALFGSPAA